MGDEKKTESSVVFASMSAELDGNTPNKIVYMPKGSWKLTPRVNGQPSQIEVDVDEDSAKILQSALEKRLADSVDPYAAFDHRPGPASFHPKQFEWDNEKGVVLEVDWTKAGTDAVSGRDYKYFSPTFLLNGRRVVGLPQDGEIGSLTNNPAFREIKKIAASADEGGHQVTMSNAIADKLVAIQVITAEQAASADEAFIIRAIDGMHGALVMSNRALEMLKAENTDLQLRVQAVMAAEAETVINAAIEEGKIPPKDEATVKFFKDQYLAHPEQTKKVLASLLGNKVIGGMPLINVKAGDGQKVVSGQSKWEVIESQKTAVRKVMAANPSLDYDSCFNLAKEQNPTLFIEG